jgi:hypothetical protein
VTAGLVDERKRLGGGRHVPACGGRRHHADVAVQLDRLDPTELAAARERGAVNPFPENVDPQELLRGSCQRGPSLGSPGWTTTR